MTRLWLRRAASSAASLTMFARSAPDMPGVERAMSARSTSSASGILRACTLRMPSRPRMSGQSTTIWRSKRPGRVSAGSSTSGRFVAAMMITPSLDSKPSISTSSWLSVCSRSSWPPPSPAPRCRPTASISSMNRMHGALRLPCSNRSRTREAPTPTNISTKSEPDIEKNGTPASPATAFASSVLPEPGGPSSSAPFGMRPPRRWNFCGSFRNSMISCSSCFASSQPATSLNVTLGCDSSITRAFVRPNLSAALPPDCTWRTMKIQKPSSSSSGSQLNSTFTQFRPGWRTSTSMPGFVFHTRSGSSSPVPTMFVRNALNERSRPLTRTVASLRSSPVTPFSRIWRFAMLPFSTSAMKRVYEISARGGAPRLPWYMRKATSDSRATNTQKASVRNGRPVGIGTCGRREPPPPPRRESRPSGPEPPSPRNAFTNHASSRTPTKGRLR